jgi:hypothetical protein
LSSFALNALLLSTVKDPNTGTWNHASQNGSSQTRSGEGASTDYVINYGEMVMVHYPRVSNANPLSFTLGGSGYTPQDPKSISTASTFKYEEKSNYLPVFVELQSAQETREAMPIELGIMVNGVCKGAAVITDSLVMIPTYVIGDSTNFDEAEVEFVLHYGENRGDREQTVSQYAVKTGEAQNYYCSKLNFADGSYLHYVSLKEEDRNTPPAYLTKLSQNFPNPFNPSTTIKYSLGTDGPVSVDIYNVRGQRIRTLVDENQIAGNHQVVWNGLDNSNRQVSSGIYFCRMSTNGKTEMKKMLLLK